MAKEIKWTSEAEERFTEIIEYLEENWTENEIEKFITATNKVLNYIADHPVMFRRSKKKNIHEALISDKHLLIYRVKPGHIELITFWDNRQNPNRKL